MSTKKITALTELSAAPAATDMIPVVDVSDTTDASSGTTKKITATNFCKGVGIGAGTTAAEPVKIDTSNGKMGIGVGAPEGKLHIMSGDASIAPHSGADELVLENAGHCGISVLANDAGIASVYLGSTSDQVGAAIEWDYDGDTNGLLKIGASNSNAQLAFTSSGGTEAMRFDASQNLLLGGTATPTSSVGNLCLFNGTIPAASVANGVVLYAEDATGSSELKVRDEAGNVSTLSPHNFDLVGERSEAMAWSYSAKNVFVGKEIAVDMTKVIRALEKLTGESYIKIRDIDDSEKLDWATEEKKYEAEQKKEIDSYKERKAEYDAHPEKGDFNESEPAVYGKRSKPAWIK